MGEKQKAVRVKQMSNERLIDLACRVGQEINSRLEKLGNGLEKLGVEGLRLVEQGKIPVVVRFPGGHKTYTYYAPIGTQIGDAVGTPTSYTGGPSLAQVVGYGDGGYRGPTKDVLAVYKKAEP